MCYMRNGNHFIQMEYDIFIYKGLIMAGEEYG